MLARLEHDEGCRDRAHANRSAGDVDGRVAAAVNHHPALELGGVVQLGVPQDRHGVEHRGVARYGDVGAPGHLRADAKEHGVEFAFLFSREDVVDAGAEVDGNAHRLDARDFGPQLFPRHAILGDAVADHATCLGIGVVNYHFVAEASEMVGRR